MKLTFPALGNAGRLGNQLFQIAGTVGLSRSMKADGVSFPSWAYSPFFSVPGEWFTNEPGIDAGTLPQHIHPAARAYLQDYGLWAPWEDEIRGWFQPSAYAEKVLSNPLNDWVYSLERPVLAVHVRRGDNAFDPLTPNKHLYHPLRPMSYYREGIEAFPDAESVVFFSDDIPWCRSAFQDIEGARFYEGTPRPKENEPNYTTSPILDWIDLFLMCSADYFVISNSTYSWWAAFLSGKPGENIRYPVPWFGPMLSYINASLMFPPSWKPIQHAL